MRYSGLFLIVKFHILKLTAFGLVDWAFRKGHPFLVETKQFHATDVHYIFLRFKVIWWDNGIFVCLSMKKLMLKQSFPNDYLFLKKT